MTEQQIPEYMQCPKHGKVKRPKTDAAIVQCPKCKKGK